MRREIQSCNGITVGLMSPFCPLLPFRKTFLKWTRIKFLPKLHSGNWSDQLPEPIMNFPNLRRFSQIFTNKIPVSRFVHLREFSGFNIFWSNFEPNCIIFFQYLRITVKILVSSLSDFNDVRLFEEHLLHYAWLISELFFFYLWDGKLTVHFEFKSHQILGPKLFCGFLNKESGEVILWPRSEISAIFLSPLFKR